MAVIEAGTLVGNRAQGTLTPKQVDFYQTEGYLVLPHLLTHEDMETVRVAMGEKVTEIADDLLQAGMITDTRAHDPFEARLARLFDGLTDEDFLKYGRSWRDRKPGYFDLMSNSKVLDAVESLIGGEIFANPLYNVRPKVPHVAAGAVPWHQDKSYWPDANANPVITVWIPIVDATLENGCLHIWPRTHKTRVLSYHEESHTGTGYKEIDLSHQEKIQEVALPIEAGGAILFNDRCVHMSTPNNSHLVRWSVDLRYQPTDQDPMRGYGAGFLARSRHAPQHVADLQDWLAERMEHEDSNA